MPKSKKTVTNLVVLHGWTLDPGVMTKWQPMLELFKKAGLTVQFLPLPGLAKPPAQALTLQDYVDWLAKQTSQLDSFILLGHSFGGQLAIRFTSQQPAKVERLILIDSSGIVDVSLTKVLKRLVFKTLAKAGKSLTDSPLLRKVLYRFARETDYYNAEPSQRQTMQNLLKDQVLADLPKINVPTLVIWGENDQVTPIKFAKLLVDSIPNAKLKVIAGARHSPVYTHLEETMAAIKQFLTS